MFSQALVCSQRGLLPQLLPGGRGCSVSPSWGSASDHPPPPPPRSDTHPPEMATVAVGRHRTGMHSCLKSNHSLLYSLLKYLNYVHKKRLRIRPHLLFGIYRNQVTARFTRRRVFTTSLIPGNIKERFPVIEK